MILTKTAIQSSMTKGEIKIEPFNPENLNPNSYDITLAPKLKIYTDLTLDCKRANASLELDIPESGLVLRPGELYIAHSNEYTETNNLVPILNGKSSLGRLGLFVHITAGFGDNGFKGQWVLELSCIKPLRIYPNMKIAQVVYHRIEGDKLDIYEGKYVGQTGNRTSEYYKNYKA